MGNRNRNGSGVLLDKLRAQNKKDKKNQETRARVEKRIAKGANPEEFTGHANVHVRRLAWQKMGKPLPENAEERSKFLSSIRVKEQPLVEALKDATPEQAAAEVA